MQLVREALRSLRDNFSGHDPQHHTLDTLEQGVSSLVDRLHSLESQRRQARGVHIHTHTHLSLYFYLCEDFPRCYPLPSYTLSPKHPRGELP